MDDGDDDTDDDDDYDDDTADDTDDDHDDTDDWLASVMLRSNWIDGGLRVCVLVAPLNPWKKNLGTLPEISLSQVFSDGCMFVCKHTK